jgi:hypothetical protein
MNNAAIVVPAFMNEKSFQCGPNETTNLENSGAPKT